MTLDNIDVQDTKLRHSLQVIRSEYGVNCSVSIKRKDLLKFGRNQSVGTSADGYMMMTLPSGIQDETFVSTNVITHIASSSSSDTTTMTIEGHTIDVDGFTFAIQSVTLAGQTKTALTTPLARVTRAYASGSDDLVGDIYVAEDVTFTSGVPQTDSAVHLMIRSGKNQSEKCATTLSKVDFWIITNIYADVLEKTAAFAEIELQIRRFGKVFRQVATLSASTNGRGELRFDPCVIAPANSDIRLHAVASGSNVDVSGGIQGYLATVTDSPWFVG